MYVSSYLFTHICTIARYFDLVYLIIQKLKKQFKLHNLLRDTIFYYNKLTNKKTLFFNLFVMQPNKRETLSRADHSKKLKYRAYYEHTVYTCTQTCTNEQHML